jgi:hypothetical protein
MWRLAALLACVLAWAADDWQKVRDLASNSEVRVYQKDSTKPLDGKTSGATDRKLILTTKNAVLSINKADIDRVDYHPPRKMVRTDTSESNNDGSSNSQSASTSYSWSREGWQTIYQRPAGQ